MDLSDDSHQVTTKANLGENEYPINGFDHENDCFYTKMNGHIYSVTATGEKRIKKQYPKFTPSCHIVFNQETKEFHVVSDASVYVLDQKSGMLSSSPFLSLREIYRLQCSHDNVCVVETYEAVIWFNVLNGRCLHAISASRVGVRVCFLPSTGHYLLCYHSPMKFCLLIDKHFNEKRINLPDFVAQSGIKEIVCYDTFVFLVCGGPGYKALALAWLQLRDESLVLCKKMETIPHMSRELGPVFVRMSYD